MTAFVNQNHHRTSFVVVPSEHGSGFEEKSLPMLLDTPFSKTKRAVPPFTMLRKFVLGETIKRNGLCRQARSWMTKSLFLGL